MATKKDMALLGAIVAAMANAAAPFHFATAKEAENLVKEGLAEQNSEIAEGDKIATRATDAGVAAHNAANPGSDASGTEGNTNTVNTAVNTAATSTAAAALVVGTGFVPSVVRGGKGRTLYDFDSLEVGGFIFVPKTEDKPDPAKSLASTVSSATARFATPTGETKTVNKPVYQLDADGKRVKDAEGKLIKTGERPETVNVTVETRKFNVQSVEAGKVYGTFTAPGDGAVIYRSA